MSSSRTASRMSQRRASLCDRCSRCDNCSNNPRSAWLTRNVKVSCLAISFTHLNKNCPQIACLICGQCIRCQVYVARKFLVFPVFPMLV